MTTSAAITLDVDPIECYRQIHGLGPDPNLARDPIYDVAMPRFWSLISEVDGPATVFVVGKDAPRYAEAFAEARRTRSEIASHSFRHDYRLFASGPSAIAEDLKAARTALEPLAPDGSIQGFRAPGYNVSAPLLRALASDGYLYDSSLLPAPMYFGARAAALAWYALSRQPSESRLGDPRLFTGPLEPYRTTADRPHRRHPRGAILEIPITCEPATRFPLIGTSFTLLPAEARRILLERTARRLKVLTFEMHAIDLLDAADPGVPDDLAARQRDLRVPVAEKLRVFRELFLWLADHTRLRTLRDIATDECGPRTASKT